MIVLRRFLFLLCVAAAAACSQPSGPSALPDSGHQALRPAVKGTPLFYLYAVNYNGNDVAQLALYASKPYVKVIAPNLAIPGCTGPDSLTLAANHLPMLFVACYSGEIVTLKIDPTTHKLSTSKIKPVPVASPLYVLAPATGAKGQLYVDGFNGQLYQLSYTSSGVKLRHTYTTTSTYPDQMAFYTSAASVSTLFVAAPFDSATCGSVQSGDIVPWQQNADGSLVEQPVIPACSSAYHVVVAGNNLFWAAANFLGGYSLTKHTPIPVTPPVWAANNAGPSYYPDDMTAISTTRLPQQSKGSTDNFEFLSVGSDGYVTLYDEGGKVRLRTTVSDRPEGMFCTKFANGVLIGGKAYADYCVEIDGDDLNIYGVNKDGKRVHITHISPGSGPYELELAPIKI